MSIIAPPWRKLHCLIYVCTADFDKNTYLIGTSGAQQKNNNVYGTLSSNSITENSQITKQGGSAFKMITNDCIIISSMTAVTAFNIICLSNGLLSCCSLYYQHYNHDHLIQTSS